MPRSNHPLRARRRPAFDKGSGVTRIVDLFAGCGGISLGLAQASHAAGSALQIALAVDFEPLATAVYEQNFPFAERIETAPVEAFFDGELGAAATFVEQRTAASVADVDVLVGGPPCQGHSNLNNHTRRVDEKNALYLRMVRAAEILRPHVLVIENVPAVLRDRHNGVGVVEKAVEHLARIGYQAEHRVVALARLGVAQTRQRHVLLATDRGEPDPALLFDAIEAPDTSHDLRWAIGDLAGATSDSMIDREPQATAMNKERMQFLLDNDIYDLPNALRPTCQQGVHSYRSMYGRLRWTEPAQTITSGFGSIGQGRYMHPDRARALTAHEAARIQGFPDYFDFSACPTRSALATMIGNAVPPQLGAAILTAFQSLSSQSQAAESTGEPQSA
ncbi:DNA cytosine methyltransferase [Microbacterium sp. NPDC057650]|uniref:DNA cytosine methyltransferase n=1 Tax=unclassified Microbacterium TaxID=2609290 RepID=UPI003672DD31